jgi:putative hydrolase of the HAD superfamily
MEKQFYCFDLDDTLWDFHGNSKIVLEQLHRQVFDEKIPFYLFYDTYLPINDTLWADYRNGKIEVEHLKYERFYQTLKAFGIDDLDLSKWFSSAYLDALPKQTKLFPKALDVLNELKHRKKTIAILTNGFTEVQTHKIEKSGLRPYIDYLFTSEAIGVAKPHKHYFQTVMSKMQAVSQEMIMVGDSLVSDIQGATDSDIEAVWFNPNKLPLPDGLQVKAISCLSELIK